MRKAWSTKVMRRVPVEFEANYVRHGQEVCEQMYGKRATARNRNALGRFKLKRARKAYLAGQELGAVIVAGCIGQEVAV